MTHPTIALMLHEARVRELGVETERHRRAGVAGRHDRRLRTVSAIRRLRR